MPTQLALAFDAIPVTCEVQQRYHAIAPCLAGISTPAAQAAALNLGYSTITRWLREFREEGMPGLFPATHYPREPYTPERVIVQLLYFKCCAPKAGDRELATDRRGDLAVHRPGAVDADGRGHPGLGDRARPPVGGVGAVIRRLARERSRRSKRAFFRAFPKASTTLPIL